MRRLAIPAVLISVIGLGHVQTWAIPTWCSTHPEADKMVFCDDFDRYCGNPPAEPERCDPASAGTDIRDSFAMWDVWNTQHNCGWAPMVHDDPTYSSYPYSAKVGCQAWNNELGYGNTGISDGIHERFGSDYSAVRATDLTPLTVQFAMNGQSGAKMHSANLYVELGYGRANSLLPPGTNSLTNWLRSEDCSVYPGNHGDQPNYPVICRQDPRPAGCADPSTAPVLPVIAAGFVAFLDQNPCHPEGTDHWPRTDRLAFFDGRVWHTLHKGLFPDPGGSEPAPGDFLIVSGNTVHRVRVTLKSTTAIVELRVGSPVVLSRCEIPLAYVGPFSTVLMGYQMPCELTGGTWDCNGAFDCNGPCGPTQTCCVSGSPGGGTVAVDDIAIYGGQGFGDAGACCFQNVPDYTCEIKYPGDCQVLGGTFKGSGTTCEDPTTACCPPVRVDHDQDGDVDQMDFGWFQTCLSGQQIAPPTFGCRCADLDQQNDVDQTDFDLFQTCLSGPDVQPGPECGF